MRSRASMTSPRRVDVVRTRADLCKGTVAPFSFSLRGTRRTAREGCTTASALESSVGVGAPAVVSNATLRLHSTYEIIGEVGRGSYGIVYEAIERISGTKVAVKAVRCCKARAVGNREARILQSLDGCPSVVGFRGVVEDYPYKSTTGQGKVYIIMDYCTGGDLASLLQVNGPFTEEQARAVAWEMLHVLKECHEKNILHGDVKAGNFVIASSLFRDLFRSAPSALPEGWLKAVDFGTGQYIGASHLTVAQGTPDHWAPEVFGKKYLQEADMWSLGVVLYQLLTGRLPFWKTGEEVKFKSTSDLLKVILSREPELKPYLSAHCSPECVHFLQQLIIKDASQRMTVSDAQAHPWLQQYNCRGL